MVQEIDPQKTWPNSKALSLAILSSSTFLLNSTVVYAEPIFRTEPEQPVIFQEPPQAPAAPKKQPKIFKNDLPSPSNSSNSPFIEPSAPSINLDIPNNQSIKSRNQKIALKGVSIGQDKKAATAALMTLFRQAGFSPVAHTKSPRLNWGKGRQNATALKDWKSARLDQGAIVIGPTGRCHSSPFGLDKKGTDHSSCIELRYHPCTNKIEQVMFGSGFIAASHGFNLSQNLSMSVLAQALSQQHHLPAAQAETVTIRYVDGVVNCGVTRLICGYTYATRTEIVGWTFSNPAPDVSSIRLLGEDDRNSRQVVMVATASDPVKTCLSFN